MNINDPDQSGSIRVHGCVKNLSLENCFVFFKPQQTKANKQTNKKTQTNSNLAQHENPPKSNKQKTHKTKQNINNKTFPKTTKQNNQQTSKQKIPVPPKNTHTHLYPQKRKTTTSSSTRKKKKAKKKKKKRPNTRYLNSPLPGFRRQYSHK